MESNLHALAASLELRNASLSRMEELLRWASDAAATFEGSDGRSRCVFFRMPSGRRVVCQIELTSVEALNSWGALEHGSAVGAWTDGSGVPTDKAVGCAAVLKPEAFEWLQKHQHTIFASTAGKVSNNVAELTALQLALANCPFPDLQLTVHSDSEYAIGCVSKDWQPKHNRDLIAQIRFHLLHRPALFRHVYGHRGDEMNELADRLAGEARIRR